MSKPWTSFKLGLFALALLGTVVLVSLGFGVRSLHDDTTEFRTYFDEAVTGLEVGAPVRYRGVVVGTVGKVAIAPDGRFIDVTLMVHAEHSARLAWRPDADNGLRAEMQGQGLTGVKLVNVDFFDPKTHPPAALSSPPPPRYIPSTESILKALERTAGIAADRLPALTTSLVATLEHLERIFTTFEGERLPMRVGEALDGVTAAVSDLSSSLRRFDRAQIPTKIAATLERLDAAAGSVGRILERIDGDAGLVASTQRAAQAVDELGSNTAEATQDLDRTLRDVSDAARAVRAVADALERDPDMLLKGAAHKRSR